jgi:hypothetical protein
MISGQSLTLFFRLGMIFPVLILALAGCSDTGGSGANVPSGAPISCLEQVVQARYKEWKKNNADEIQRLEEISCKRNWRLLAACDRAVKVINLGDSECETIYSSKNRLRYAGIQPNGSVALLEVKRGISKKDSESYLVILENSKEALRLKLSQSLLQGNYLGGIPVFADDKFVIYPDGNNAMLYETQLRENRLVYEGRQGSSLLTIQSAANRFFLVLTDSKRNPANSEMVILDSSFHAKRNIPQVTNAMICGDRMLIEQNGAILEYDIEMNTTTHIIDGTLLAVIDDMSFLFADSVWKTGKNGWLKLNFSICEYDLREMSSRKIAGKFSIDTCYGVTYPIVSPDNEYVIISDNTDSALLDSEYLVYKISNGEKVCAFYEPYLGKHYFTHLLEWSDNINESTITEVMPLGSQ